MSMFLKSVFNKAFFSQKPSQTIILCIGLSKGYQTHLKKHVSCHKFLFCSEPFSLFWHCILNRSIIHIFSLEYQQLHRYFLHKLSYWLKKAPVILLNIPTHQHQTLCNAGYAATLCAECGPLELEEVLWRLLDKMQRKR